MNLIKKRKILFLIPVLIIIVLVTIGVIKKDNNAKETDQKMAEQKNIVNEIPVKVEKKVKFTTNDEIKNEYGKLETVTLWNGRTYTGAVINTNELYTIVTVNGTIKIPMKDVKMREIIR